MTKPIDRLKNCPACNSTHVARQGNMVSCTCGFYETLEKWNDVPRKGDLPEPPALDGKLRGRIKQAIIDGFDDGAIFITDEQLDHIADIAASVVAHGTAGQVGIDRKSLRAALDDISDAYPLQVRHNIGTAFERCSLTEIAINKIVDVCVKAIAVQAVPAGTGADLSRLISHFLDDNGEPRWNHEVAKPDDVWCTECGWYRNSKMSHAEDHPECPVPAAERLRASATAHVGVDRQALLRSLKSSAEIAEGFRDQNTQKFDYRKADILERDREVCQSYYDRITAGEFDLRASATPPGSDAVATVKNAFDEVKRELGNASVLDGLGRTIAALSTGRMDSPLVWSMALPTGPGYYWKRPMDHLDKTVIRVYRQGHGSKRLLYLQVGEVREDVLSGLIPGRYEFTRIPEPQEQPQ